MAQSGQEPLSDDVGRLIASLSSENKRLHELLHERESHTLPYSGRLTGETDAFSTNDPLLFARWLTTWAPAVESLTLMNVPTAILDLFAHAIDEGYALERLIRDSEKAEKAEKAEKKKRPS